MRLRAEYTLLTGLLSLGAYFDERLSMSKHVNQIVRSCFYQLRCIRYIQHSLTTTAAIHLVNAFIVTRVDYCNSILIGLPRYQLNRIPSVLNVVAQIIYGHSRFDHIMPILIL